MVRLEQLAAAALSGDALALRSLSQDWLAQTDSLTEVVRPENIIPDALVVAAALVELFAQRRGEQPPEWTSDVGEASQPTYLLKSVEIMPRLRRLCELESPEPLRRRNLFAPPTFLEMA